MSYNNFKKDKTKKKKDTIEIAKQVMIEYKDVLEGLKDK